MRSDEPDVLARSVQKAREWIDETADELGIDNRRTALRSLRAVLHALRDHIGVNESAHLAAQLPELIRGIYYEEWVPARVPESQRDRGEFLRRIVRDARLSGETEASFAVSAVIAVLSRHVSPGELDDVAKSLPTQLRELVGSPAR